jgi:hypothetical protein
LFAKILITQRQSEVSDIRSALAVDQDVGRFDIAMD